MTRRNGRLALVGYLALSAVGVLVLLGCVLALYLEWSGLGGPRDGGVRLGYMALLVGGALAGALVPVGAWFAVRRSPRRSLVAVTSLGVVAVVVGALVVALLGVSGSMVLGP